MKDHASDRLEIEPAPPESVLVPDPEGPVDLEVPETKKGILGKARETNSSVWRTRIADYTIITNINDTSKPVKPGSRPVKVTIMSQNYLIACDLDTKEGKAADDYLRASDLKGSMFWELDTLTGDSSHTAKADALEKVMKLHEDELRGMFSTEEIDAKGLNSQDVTKNDLMLMALEKINLVGTGE